ncbi:hypothetical protein KR018_004454 [Drosophila ironensis]|nr:hypothetical protein KR018_004454 [Drosophila ironensis]
MERQMKLLAKVLQADGGLSQAVWDWLDNNMLELLLGWALLPSNLNFLKRDDKGQPFLLYLATLKLDELQNAPKKYSKYSIVVVAASDVRGKDMRMLYIRPMPSGVGDIDREKVKLAIKVALNHVEAESALKGKLCGIITDNNTVYEFGNEWMKFHDYPYLYTLPQMVNIFTAKGHLDDTVCRIFFECNVTATNSQDKLQRLIRHMHTNVPYQFVSYYLEMINSGVKFWKLLNKSGEWGSAITLGQVTIKFEFFQGLCRRLCARVAHRANQCYKLEPEMSDPEFARSVIAALTMVYSQKIIRSLPVRACNGDCNIDGQTNNSFTLQDIDV